ncbi:hypothetical protein ACWDR3_35635 [Streptomyces sp. NPDC001002]
MTVAALLEEHPASYLLPGTDLRIESEAEHEADVHGIPQDKTIPGNTKTSPDNFDAVQTEHHLDTSTRPGADIHPTASPRHIRLER